MTAAACSRSTSTTCLGSFAARMCRTISWYKGINLFTSSSIFSKPSSNRQTAFINGSISLYEGNMKTPLFLLMMLIWHENKINFCNGFRSLYFSLIGILCLWMNGDWTAKLTGFSISQELVWNKASLSSLQFLCIYRNDSHENRNKCKYVIYL